MNVLQILPQLNYGGVEVGTVDLAQALIERGHKACVISAGGELVGRLIKMGVQHYELPVHAKSLKTLAMIQKVRAIIVKEGIDIVHARSRIPAWIAYFAIRNTDAKFVTTCHGYYSKHLLSTIMGWGEKVIVISRAIGRHMIDDFGVLPERITLIHRGIDLSKYSFDKAKYDAGWLRGKEKIIIANIGRLTPIKGHEYFIKAIHLVSHHFPQIEAWIVGGASKRHTKYVDRLKILVDKLGMNTVVKFVGVEKNIPELLKKVDLLVLSTTYPEGFGRVIIEAGASGVAVVATKVGGVTDIVDDGKHGLLVPPRDEIKMSNAIVHMLQHHTLTRTCVLNLRKKVESVFTVKTMIDNTLRVYGDVRHQRRILVIKLGAFGDIVLAIPSLRMIRKKFPKAYIAVLIDADFILCLENCPYIDEIIPFKRKDKKRQFIQMKNLIKKLRRYSFDISVDFQNNKKTHLIAFLAGISSRYGYKRDMFGSLLTHRVGSFSDPLPPVQHQFRVLSLLGVSQYDERLELWPQKEDLHYIDTIFSGAWISQKQKKVGLILGASKRWYTKRWPTENFVILSRRLIEELGCRVVLIGDLNSKKERDLFFTTRNNEVLDMIGSTTITQLVALIAKLDCIVCGDTAPLHIASAMKTKIVALFGPTDPRRHMPPGTNHKVLRRNLACAPCYKEQCSCEYRCMREINVEDVFQAVKGQLGL
ncbi:MAG: lipopolysaccharide heptosyltransferase II [Candidatus Omnitrophica bacterium]|nr:lipopolysaccharide heptosyltransferase II [Candidatus Omnitrophota bacterium]